MTSPLQEKIIKEIISTEEAYLLQLEKLTNFFSKPILERGLLPTHVHSAIFGQIPAIRYMNDELFEELKLQKNVGLAFLKLGPFMKVYSSYANNFQKSLTLLQEWEEKNPDLKNLISQNETRPEVQLKLTALLITPVQRIPRYRLLLEELYKCSNQEDSFYDDIKGALEQICNVACHMNRSLEDSLELQHLLTIQKALRNQTPQIIEPGRKLIKEGILNKVSRKGKGSQERLFFLFNDMLMYTTFPVINSSSSKNWDGSKIELKPNTLDCCCLFPLRYCRVTTLFGSNNQGITFRLQCSDEDLLLYSKCSSQGEGWVSAIKEAAQLAINKRKTLRKESSYNRAVRRPALKKQRYLKENSPSPSQSPSENTREKIKAQILSAKDCLTPPQMWLTPKRKNGPMPHDKFSTPGHQSSSPNYATSPKQHHSYHTRSSFDNHSSDTLKSPPFSSPYRTPKLISVPSRALSPEVVRRKTDIQTKKRPRPLSDIISSYHKQKRAN